MKNIRWMLHGLIAVMLLCRAGAALAEVVVLPVDDSAGLPVNEAYYQDATHYQDPSIQVSIETYPWEQTVCYVARITIANPTQLRTASAYGFNRKQVASVQDMANRMNAVLAINGDYSYYQLSTVGCYLLRQGQSYCQRLAPGRDLLVIDENGDFTILQSCTEETLAGYSAGAMVNTFNFGPGLVVNGQPLADNYRAMFNSSLTRNQRAAIAQVEKGKLEYICAVCEGDKESKDGGLTMKEWSDFMMTLGVENAYNLDGGNSTAIIFHNQKINAVQNPRHRKLSDIIYFASAYQE
ncbi:MAG: phosphodiester glycosidase family protein [Clostridiales bacterium]|nr:phosphodiester glycosidase family protein [Clostridiales bacterium]